MFTDPPPTQADIANFYEGDYHAQLRHPGASERAFGAKFDEYCRWLALHLQRRPGERALDIGCATGLLVAKLAEAGYLAEGYEANAVSAEWGRKHYGVPIHTGFFDPFMADEASYDLITLCDVLEHTAHPLRYVTALRSALRPNGHLLVTFPDVWSLEGRYYRAMSLLFHREWLWKTCHVPAHIWEFTPSTARHMFESAGYEVKAFRRGVEKGEPWKWAGMASLIDLPPQLLSWGPLSNLFGTQMQFLLTHHR